MAHDNYPKGAGLGRDPNPHNPTLIDFDWTMQHGSRAQRREIMRQLKAYRRQGVPGAAAAFHGMQAYAEARTSLKWIVRLPDREPFSVVCPQRATAHDILRQWPGAIVEAVG